MDEFEKKTDATILGIIYHPELRSISEQAKKDIAEMTRTLAHSLVEPGYCRFVKCVFSDRCDAVCDWAKEAPQRGKYEGI